MLAKQRRKKDEGWILFFSIFFFEREIFEIIMKDFLCKEIIEWKEGIAMEMVS